MSIASSAAVVVAAPVGLARVVVPPLETAPAGRVRAARGVSLVRRLFLLLAFLSRLVLLDNAVPEFLLRFVEEKGTKLGRFESFKNPESVRREARAQQINCRGKDTKHQILFIQAHTV